MHNVNYKSRTSLAGALLVMLALASMPSSANANPSTTTVPTSATTTTKTSDVGAKMLTAAQGLLGASRPSGYCQMFAEEVLTAAGNTIPKQVGASQAWDYFRSNWQKHGPCAPQPWDASKAQGGDLVFWSAGQSGSTCHSTYGHVAIYDGAGGIIENAGRGITQDKPVAYPCSTDPVGFVPMTSCNGVKNDFTQANNASNQDATVAGQAPAASTSQASTSSPGGSSSPASASSSSDMMSQMMMMMMMQQMMQPMQQAMSQAGQGNNPSNGSGSGTGTGAGNGSGNGTGSSNGGGSANNGSGSSGSGSSSGDDEEDQPLLSLVEEFIDRLVSSLEELLNGTTPASGTQAAASGSGTGTQSSVMQQLQQLEEQQQAQLKNQPGASVASPTSALVSQADGTDSARPPADPTQDWHNGRRDYRLSCGRLHGAGNVEACRAATATE